MVWMAEDCSAEVKVMGDQQSSFRDHGTNGLGQVVDLKAHYVLLLSFSPCRHGGGFLHGHDVPWYFSACVTCAGLCAAWCVPGKCAGACESCIGGGA